MFYEKKHILRLKRLRIGENRKYNSNNIYIDRNERSIDFQNKFYSKFTEEVKSLRKSAKVVQNNDEKI